MYTENYKTLMKEIKEDTLYIKFCHLLFSFTDVYYIWASRVAQLVKNPLTMQETLVLFLDWEDPMAEG